MRGIRENLNEMTGIHESERSAMALGLAHSLSRYKLKFSPDKVDTMIVQVRHLLRNDDILWRNNFRLFLFWMILTRSWTIIPWESVNGMDGISQKWAKLSQIILPTQKQSKRWLIEPTVLQLTSGLFMKWFLERFRESMLGVFDPFFDLFDDWRHFYGF